MRASFPLPVVVVLALLAAGPFGAGVSVASAAPPAPNPVNPAQPVKLVFVHHSTGENWISDGNGDLGLALRNANYFVSDTNYGWGPPDDDWGSGTIGDHTDIGNWYSWFSGPHRDTYLAALLSESGQNSSYSRLATDPGGANRVVMFKSCFPNSALGGSPSDPIPPIESNPLRGQDAGSSDHTIANAKGIYRELLNAFGTRTETLFVVITAPPLTSVSTDATQAANARAFNEWLRTEWLAGYPYRNVTVFDVYNVLTSNGGSTRTNDPNTNDLGWSDGNHHRFRSGALQHQQTVANNFSAYGSAGGDSHPTRAGSLKATGEFPTLLNTAYHCWVGDGGCERPGRPFYTLPPCRVLDTRNETGPLGGPALVASSTRTFVLAGTCGIPADAVSVSANVTVTGAAATGELGLFPDKGVWAGTSTISFRVGLTRASNAVLTLASDGSGGVAVRNGSPGAVHVILDVNGYWR